jgi:hypothetical protein
MEHIPYVFAVSRAGVFDRSPEIDDATDSSQQTSSIISSLLNLIVTAWNRFHDSFCTFDDHKIIKVDIGDAGLESRHFNYLLDQSLLSEWAGHGTDCTRHQLELMMLQSHAKVATVGEQESRILGIQTSPLLPRNSRYHRSTKNELLDSVDAAFAKSMGLPANSVTLVHSRLIHEAFDRNLPESCGISTKVNNIKEFRALVRTLFEQAANGKKAGGPIAIDYTELTNKKNALELMAKVLTEEANRAISSNPNGAAEIRKMASQIHPVAYIQHKGKTVMLTPPLNHGVGATTLQRHRSIRQAVYSVKESLGFRLGPIEAKEAWLRVQSMRQISDKTGLPMAKLATRGQEIPTVFENFSRFLEHPTVQNFKNLETRSESHPYLQVLPGATHSLLAGLSRIDVDEGFRKEGLTPLLQATYYRLLIAMAEAELHWDNPIAFFNQIELIHQEIQTILAVTQPYDINQLENAVLQKIQSGDNPLISSDFSVHVHAKPSAMRCVASLLSAVERQQGERRLNVVVQEDAYYEASGVISDSSNVTKLSGDRFIEGGIAAAMERPSEPIDLFVAEFHHNISLDRRIYRVEQVTEQIKAMVKEGYFAKTFTIALDTTIDLEQSDEVRALLSDPEIAELIKSGRMNLVMYRSAQKFDMFGMDNYYGGIAVCVNHSEAFKAFNERMALPEDQLGGLCYQGLAHLQTYGAAYSDKYRQGIMDNTQRLYQSLPPAMIYKEGNQNPLQISAINDHRSVFLDVKSPKSPQIAKAFWSRLNQFALEEQLPVTRRPSFGFPTTNLTRISGTKFRINPGLDDASSINRYTEFFHNIQLCLDNNQGQSDENIALAITRLRIGKRRSSRT